MIIYLRFIISTINPQGQSLWQYIEKRFIKRLRLYVLSLFICSFASVNHRFHYWSRHHSVFRGTIIFLGWLKTRLHTSFGTLTHSSWGLRLGISLVTSLQVFIGTRSHVSSGISIRLSASSSSHSSSPSTMTQPWPQTSKGSFSHFVLVIVFLCWKCKVFMEILFFDHLLKIVNLMVQDENLPEWCRPFRTQFCILSDPFHRIFSVVVECISEMILQLSFYYL